MAEAHFWARVQVGTAEQCWPWLRGVDHSGYGKFVVGGRTVYAATVAWELTNGRPVPAGSVLVRRCGNHRCVNPEHLECVARGHVHDRQRSRSTQRAPVPLALSATHLARRAAPSLQATRATQRPVKEPARLSEARVVEILTARFREGANLRQLAERFGISPWTARAICRRQSWKHVPLPEGCAEVMSEREKRTTGSDGTRMPNARLTEEQVRAILYARLVERRPLKELSTRFGVSDWTVKAISHRRIWRHVPAPEVPVTAPEAKVTAAEASGAEGLTAEQVRALRDAYARGVSPRKLAQRFGLDAGVAREVARGHLRSEISAR